MKAPSKLKWFTCGALVGLTSLSISLASVPRNRITDDTAIYQNLSEIRVPKAGSINFDSDLMKLSAAEFRYKEKLPSLASKSSLRGPIKRISVKKYRFSGKQRLVSKRN